MCRDGIRPLLGTMVQLPIASFRHQLQLRLYRTLALIGLAIAAYGLFNLWPSVLLAIGLAMDNGSGPGLDWPTVLTIVAQGAATTLGGVILTILSYRTYNARRRAGPPPDSNAMEKTPLRRLLAIAIYGIAALYAGANLAAATQMTIRDLLLLGWGEHAVGRVFDVRPAPEIDDNVEQLTYRFRAADGKILDGIKNQWAFAAERIGMDDAVEVTYLPASPMTNIVGFSFELKDLISIVGLQFVVFAVGIWGVLMNTGLLKRHPLPASEAAPPATPPRVRAVPVSTRASFGRRTGGAAL